jgi:hypothetical protein
MSDGKMLKATFVKECAHYRTARAAGDVGAAWHALERGHIVSQPVLSLHLKSHSLMLGFALNQRDGFEAFGQVIRLLLAPLGALTGKIPWGNTGRAHVSAFRPMPIPDDLAPLLEEKL